MSGVPVPPHTACRLMCTNHRGGKGGTVAFRTRWARLADVPTESMIAQGGLPDHKSRSAVGQETRPTPDTTTHPME